MNSNPARLAGIVVLLAATSLVGCARQEAGASPTPASTPRASVAATNPPPLATPSSTPLPVVAMPSNLQAKWKSIVRGTTASSGECELQITPNDMLLQNPGGGDQFSLEPIAITASTLTLPADSGCPDQSTVTEGSYTYTLSNGVLRFTAVSDSCGDRKGVLDQLRLEAVRGQRRNPPLGKAGFTTHSLVAGDGFEPPTFGL